MAATSSGKAAAGKQIHCPVCGKVMTIPPGYENTPGKCPDCGVTVNDGTESLVDMLDSPVVAARRVAAGQTVDSRSGEPWMRPVLLAGVWGLAGGAAGMAITVFAVFVIGDSVSGRGLAAFLAGAGFGCTLGFVLAFGWALNRYRALSVWASALGAGAAAALIGTGSYLAEWGMVAPPDSGIPETAIMNLLGGGVAGIILWYCSNWWNEHS